MMLAILSDIHANLEALNACLAHAARHGATDHAFLGDLVGYGADPQACLDIVRAHAARGALVLRGNHDEAALGGPCEDMNFIAREAALWTRARLTADERRFLSELPYRVEREGRLFVHASAHQPQDWDYVADTDAAARCLAATNVAQIFAGHIHHPLLFFSVRARVSAFVPQPGVSVPLSAHRRWIALTGSVGQPRDGNPAAAYMLFDPARRLLTHYRVPYDWMRAAAKIRAAGLPDSLAARLAHGE